MLVTNAYKANDVVTVKLMNGEEVVGKFVEITDDTFKISKPRALTLMQDPNPPHNVGLALVPWLMGIDDSGTIGINKSTILTHSLAKKSTTDQYLQSTSSIVIPRGGLTDLNLGKH